MRFTQQIREAVAAELNTLVGYTVYPYFKDNIDKQKLPALTVTIGSGVWENGASDCLMPCRIEIKDYSSKIDNKLDDHAEIIEPLFPIGHTLNELVEYMIPESFDYSFDSESNTGIMGLNFNIKWEK